MSKDLLRSGFETTLISRLMKLPILAFYAETRGWYFLISLCHRITGVFLVIFVWFYIYSLLSMNAPGPKFFLIGLLEWILAVPFVFHAFNGGRLILYESFGKRNDETMIRWVFGLSFVYIALLGVIMLMGNQSVSPFFFWLIISVTALIAGYGVIIKIWNTGHSVFWKFQRISGAFLLVMVPAYILFIHLNPSPETGVNMVITGIQKIFIKVAYLILLVSGLFHGGYGIWSVASDYLYSRIFRIGLACLVILVMLISCWIGIRVTLIS